MALGLVFAMASAIAACNKEPAETLDTVAKTGSTDVEQSAATTMALETVSTEIRETAL